MDNKITKTIKKKYILEETIVREKRFILDSGRV